MAKINRALLSVTDKTGIVEFAGVLAALGVELVSAEAAKLLRDAGLAVRDVAELTGFPEMLDGRVKTIHPRVAAGVLAVRSKPEHMASLAEHNLPLIDMVVVNLYDFASVAAKADAPIEELIENIDIGGPTMIRAAAKNWQDVAVVVSPTSYQSLAAELKSAGSLSRESHWKLMLQAFALTAAYDSAIAARLLLVGQVEQALPATLDLHVPRSMALRYGENPHQSAALYSNGKGGVAGARQLQGKELSYNNLVDLDAAWQLIGEFTEPACAIIKHTNPCGLAEGVTLTEAYKKALEADPVSAFGGVLAFNRTVDTETAEEISKIFTEAIAAPGYMPGAVEVFQAKKNLRILEVDATSGESVTMRSMSGGILVQTADTHALDRSECRVVTKRQPTEAEWRSLEFGWKAVKHVKSNAIVYAKDGQLLSAGAGQMSRVDSVKIGASKAALPLQGCVVASDAFFPFADGLEEAVSKGATAAIQPGGSVKDPDVIAAADRLGIAMIFTGVRHFRH